MSDEKKQLDQMFEMPEYEILRGIERIHAKADEINRIVQRLYDISSVKTPELVAEQERLTNHLMQLPVIRGEREITLEEVFRNLRGKVPKEVLDRITPDNIWMIPPFSLLGQIAVTDEKPSPERWGIPLVRELFPVFYGESSIIKRPCFVPGNQRGHTFWMHCEKGWWTTLLIVTQYWAKTKTTADGVQAAPFMGGLYLAARDACLYLDVPSTSSTWDKVVMALIKAACCKYAESAPEIPWTAQLIGTMVCEPGSSPISEGEDYLSAFDLPAPWCSVKKENYTSEVKDTMTVYAGWKPLGNPAHAHLAVFEPGVIATYSASTWD